MLLLLNSLLCVNLLSTCAAASDVLCEPQTPKGERPSPENHECKDQRRSPDSETEPAENRLWIGRGIRHGKISPKNRIEDALLDSTNLDEFAFSASRNHWGVRQLPTEDPECPHVRHSKPAQRRSGSDSGHFDYFEWPLPGYRAAVPRPATKFCCRPEPDFAASATGRNVPRFSQSWPAL